jgi:hypothetical protein
LGLDLALDSPAFFFPAILLAIAAALDGNAQVSCLINGARKIALLSALIEETQLSRFWRNA